MALSRFWSAPNSNFTSTSVAGAVTDTAVTGGVGWNLGADSIQVPTLVTAPANSASVAVFTTQSASVAVATQNTLGYDAEFVGYLNTTNASVATFQIGVGATTPVAMTNVASSFTSAVNHVLSFPAYVPTGYYYSVQITQANGQAVAGTVTIVANPV